MDTKTRPIYMCVQETTGYPNAKQTKPINRLKITLMFMTMDQLSKVWHNDKMEICASIKKRLKGWNSQ